MITLKLITKLNRPGGFLFAIRSTVITRSFGNLLTKSQMVMLNVLFSLKLNQMALMNLMIKKSPKLSLTHMLNEQLQPLLISMKISILKLMKASQTQLKLRNNYSNLVSQTTLNRTMSTSVVLMLKPHFAPSRANSHLAQIKCFPKCFLKRRTFFFSLQVNFSSYAWKR